MRPTLPSPAVRAGDARRPEWTLLILATVAYCVLFFVLYPPLCGIEDEVGFVNQAVVWLKGSLSAESAGFEKVTDFVLSGGRHVGWRNPGRSVLIMPFVAMFGLNSMFVTGMLIHALTVLAAAAIHTRLGQSPLWALLVLFHPTLGLYSRTVMGDAPSGLFVLLAVLAALSPRHPGLLAGLCVGLAAVMRYHAGMLLPLFAFVLWRADWLPKPRREAVLCMLSGGVLGLGIAAYNLVAFSKPLGWTGQGFFSISFLTENLPFYAISLMVLWPGMMLAPLLDRSATGLFARLGCYSVLALFAVYYFHDRSPSLVQSLVIGQRLLQCVIPLWIVSYASVLSTRVAPLLRIPAGWVRPAVASAAAVLLVAQGVVFDKHQKHLEELLSVRKEVARLVPAGSTVVANYTLSKVFAIADPSVPAYRWLLYNFGDRVLDHSDTLLAAPRPWFLAVLPKNRGDEHPDALARYVRDYSLQPVPAAIPGLIVLRTPDR